MKTTESKLNKIHLFHGNKNQKKKIPKENAQISTEQFKLKKNKSNGRYANWKECERNENEKRPIGFLG